MIEQADDVLVGGVPAGGVRTAVTRSIGQHSNDDTEVRHIEAVP